MKKRVSAILLTLIMLVSLLPAASASAAADYSTVKVKLSTNNASTITMAVSGTYFIYENGVEFTDGTLTLRVSGSNVTATHSSDGLLYEGSSFSIMRARIDPSAGGMKFNSRYYLGHFIIKRASGGYIQVVNELPLAHYLYGVVAYEMSNTFPSEALKAQAVAAKSYVIANMKGTSEYNLGDTSSDQVYKGYNSSYTNVINAVNSTISEFLTYNGNVLCAWYAASNGGETSLPSYAWSGKSGFNGAYAVMTDEYDLANQYSPMEAVRILVGQVNQFGTQGKMYAFLVNRAKEALGREMNYVDYIYAASTSGERNSGTVRNQLYGEVSMQVSNRDSSGGILDGPYDVNVKFNLSDMYNQAVFVNKSLRTYWGAMGSDGYFYFYHGRYGHGVGLSQRGAQQRGASGQSYRSILDFYYPGASISNYNITPPTDPVNVNQLPTGEYADAVTTYKTYYYKKASTSATKVSKTKIPKGTQIQVYSADNGWVYIVYDGKAGYFREKYIKYITITPSPTPIDMSALTVQAYGTTTGSVNYRTGPGDDYDKVGKLKKKTELTLYGEIDGWYAFVADNALVYVTKKYVKITGYPTDPNATPAPTATPDTVIGTGEINAKVNFRTGPDTSSKRIKQLKKGAEVNILAKDSNGWYKIEVGGVTGYVLGKYVDILTSVDPNAPVSTPTPVPGLTEGSTAIVGVLRSSGVSFREGPSTKTKRIKKLSRYMTVYIVGESGDWYYVKQGDTLGYVSKSYVYETGAVKVNATGGFDIDLAGYIGLGTTTSKVTARASASSKGKAYGTIAKDVSLYIYEHVDGWYKVKLSTGTDCYVQDKYIALHEN